jgi:hypothetical protein
MSNIMPWLPVFAVAIVAMALVVIAGVLWFVVFRRRPTATPTASAATVVAKSVASSGTDVEFRRVPGRVQVLLGVSFIDDASLAKLEAGVQGWETVAGGLAGVWLNTAGTDADNSRSGWLARLIKNTDAGAVFGVQNIESADGDGAGACGPPDSRACVHKRVRFEKNFPRTPGDGYGRSAGPVVASGNMNAVLTNKIRRFGVVPKMLGYSVVTDYVCGHNCLPNEDWQPGDLDVAREFVADKVDGTLRPPAFVSSRRNWWPSPRGPANPVLARVARAADGIVYESAPINLLDSRIGKLHVTAIANAHAWCRANDKPLVWLAPRGADSSKKPADYLATMQRAMKLLEARDCLPDGVVVINYTAGANADSRLPALPETLPGGASHPDTLTGVAHWLLKTYGS